MTEKGFEVWVKKPIPVKAKQMPKAFMVMTLEGIMRGKKGDFLVIGIRGERYPVDQEIFKASYKKRVKP